MALEMVVTKGSTNVIAYPKWLKKSDGTPGTDIAFDAAGINLRYIREGFDDVGITPIEGTDPDVADDAHSDGQLLHVAEGVSRLDLPDAIFATGVTNAKVVGSTTAHIMEDIHITLIDGTVGAETATQTSVDDLETHLDTIESKIDTVDTVADAVKAKTDNLPTDPADESLIIAATDAIAALVTTVDTVVDAIKVQTDKFVFTVANEVNANTRYIAGTQLQGVGTAGNKWRPV